MERKRLPNGDLEYLIHFNKRVYCDRQCMAKGFEAKPKTGTSWATTHAHARKLCPPGPCERCGVPDARDVHHRDGNHLNNLRENLERICRSCHIREHQQATSCMICGGPHKGLGYCEKHYQRLKRHGDPMATIAPVRKACSICGEPAHSKGLCGKHYMRAKRAGEFDA